jgi:PQQ-dependent catabolism-associated CXXCW motif protein
MTGVEPDPLSGEWAFASPHETIPGSQWVPNVGTGTLTKTMEAYFRAALLRAAGPPPGKALVIFCERDCWVSWNAAKRAASWGYASVNWYPDGTNGWRDAGLPLSVAAKPQPVQMD